MENFTICISVQPRSQDLFLILSAGPRTQDREKALGARLYICGVKITQIVESQLITFPLPNAHLQELLFSCRQWKPYENRDVVYFVPEGVPRLKAIGPFFSPAKSSRIWADFAVSLIGARWGMKNLSRWVADSTTSSLSWLWIISSHPHSFSMRCNLDTWKGSQ